MIEELRLVNLTQAKEIFIDKLTTKDYILDYANFGQVPIEFVTDKFLNQFGSSVSHINVSERDIEIVGNIIANSNEEMTFRKVNLNKFFNPLEEFKAVYKNFEIAFKLSRSIQYTTDEPSNNEVICRFKINGIAHYPLFTEEQSSEAIVAGFSPMFHFPLILYAKLDNEIPPALQQQRGVVFGKKNVDNKISIVSNEGDVEVGVVITVRAKNGSVENPKIVNDLTEEFFEINKTLSDGEIVIISTVVGDKYIKGSTDGVNYNNYFAYKTLDSTWLSLRKGSNLFTYEATSGEDYLEVEIEYKSAYMEVQECF